MKFQNITLELTTLSQSSSLRDDAFVVCMSLPLSAKNHLKQLMDFAITEADCVACIKYLKQECHNETDLRLRSKETRCLTSHFISVLLHLEALKTSPAALYHSSIAALGSVV